MKNIVAALVVAGLVVSAEPTSAVPPFTEDFTTTTYQGTLTDAVWDTLAGQLTLTPFTPTSVGGVTTSHFARDVAVAGDVAFVADGSAGLTIVSIADPAAPVVYTSMATGNFATGVCVSGDLAFIADGNDGLQVVDISNPYAPSILGSYNTFGYALKVDVSGDLAFVADDDGGVVIVDVSDPANPSLVSLTATNHFPQDVHVDGHHLYVADGQFGLTVLDIANPAAPVQIDAVSATGIAYGVVVRGNHVYLASGPAGLQVYDVTDPTNCQLTGSYDTSGSAEAIAVTGDRAFLCAANTGVQVLDVSDPVNPTLMFTYDSQGSVFGVAPVGGLAYLADGFFGLQSVRVADDLPLRRADYISYSIGSVDIHLDGNLMYLARNSGMSLHDVTDPTRLRYLGYQSAGSNAVNAVWGQGNRGYLGVGTTVQVLDVTVPASIGTLATDAFASTVRDIGGFGSYLCVLHGSTLEIVDVSAPTAPATTGTLALPSAADVVKVDGQIAYLAADGAGVFIVDVSDPANPALLGSYNTPGLTNDVYPDGDLLYVADWFPDAFIILDVSDPTTPSLLSNTATAFDVRGAYAMGGDAFVLLGNNELVRYDVRDPTSPVAMDTDDTFTGTRQVIGNGRYVFVRCTDGDEFLDVEVFQPYQDEVGVTLGTAESSSIYNSNYIGDPIIKMRLQNQDQGVVTNYIVAGGSEQYLQDNNTWVTVNNPSWLFRWRAYLSWSPDVNPSVSSLTFDWLYDAAQIMSIDDVPNDQGRQVRVSWKRSGHDFYGDTNQIVEYAVYRQIDPGLGKATTELPAGTSPLIRDHAAEMKSLGWDFVAAVPVLTEDYYSVVVPTLADSTVEGGDHQSVFRVSALTVNPGQAYHSVPDSGQSLDNLAPSVPANLLWAGSVLNWDESEDADFRHFTVYGSASDILDEAAVVIGHATAPALDLSGQPYAHYHVTASDFAGNESDAATTLGVSSVPDRNARFALHGNTPNPFNPTTRISFELAEPTAVRLRVLDVAGRVVRTLINGELLQAGRGEIAWDGRDSAGQISAAGVYFYRIEAGHFADTRRMVLVK